MKKCSLSIFRDPVGLGLGLGLRISVRAGHTHFLLT